jgi:Flp pilus assembly pilin Flp
MKERGFSTIEYAILIAVTVAALLAMQTYIGRAINGRWRQAADSIGFGMQYAEE